MSRSSRRLITLLGASLLALSQLGAATAVLATHDHPRRAATTPSSSPPTACARTPSKQYADAGRHAHDAVVPAQRRLRVGQRPADPGAAEHRRRLVHAGHRRVAGRPRLDQQHLPHQSGQPFANRTAAFDPGVAPGRDDRPVGRARRQEGRPDRVGRRRATPRSTARRSTSETFFSGRGVATNYIGTSADPLFDDAAFIAAFGLQFDHPAGFAGQAPFAGAAPTDATGWTDVPGSYSPAQGDAPARPRRRRRQVRPERLHLRQHARRQDRLRPRAVLAHRRTAPTRSPTSSRASWADVKVKIVGGALDGKTAGMLVKVEELSKDLSQVRLFHTSVTRAIASWPTWPGEPGFTGDFEEYVAETFPSSTAGDFAVLEAGVVSEDTYVEQGLYWETGHQPLLKYVDEDLQAGPRARRLPDHRRVPAPVPRPGHQEAARTAPPTRPTTTSRSTAPRTTASASARRYIRAAYEGADDDPAPRPQADGPAT